MYIYWPQTFEWYVHAGQIIVSRDAQYIWAYKMTYFSVLFFIYLNKMV